jgi:8-oxo-dGTP diphosphatase
MADIPKTFFIGVKGIIVKDGKVLLLKRAGERTFWDVPGGRMQHDETPAATLARELQEELPSIQNVEIGGLLSVHVLDRNIKDDIGLTFLFYWVNADFDEGIQLSDEHSESAWMTFDEAKQSGSDGMVAIVDALLARMA